MKFKTVRVGQLLANGVYNEVNAQNNQVNGQNNEAFTDYNVVLARNIEFNADYIKAMNANNEAFLPRNADFAGINVVGDNNKESIQEIHAVSSPNRECRELQHFFGRMIGAK